MDYKLYWSEEAISNLEEILNYLNSEWTSKEVNKFKSKLSKQLEMIIHNPLLFPISQHNPRLRKAVLSRQTTVFYEIKDNIIYLAYLFVNRKNISRII